MNKILVSFVFLFTANFSSFAQYGFHKVDVSIGILAPVLGYGIANVEYTLTDSYSLNLQVIKRFNKEEFNDGTYGDLSISPALRYFAADNEAKGFFVEGFIKYKNSNLESGKVSIFGGGIGIGYKKVTSFGLLFGSNIGAGYGVNIDDSTGATLKRGSLFIGWRF